MPENAFTLESKRTALLLMDYQEAVLNNLPADKDAILANAAKLHAAAHQAKVQVIHVVIGFRAGHPEASPKNKAFGAIKGTGRFGPGFEGANIHPALAPKDGDLVTTKKRYSAFVGSDLEVLLRGLQIDTLILTGIVTSGVVLSTLRQAADMDFRLAVVADACADRDPEVHRVLTQKVFLSQAEVMETAAMLELMKSAKDV